MSMAPDLARALADTLVARTGWRGALALDAPPTGAAETRWRACGLAALTGPVDGPPVTPKRDLAASLEALLSVTRAFAGVLGEPLALDMAIYSERITELGLVRRGASSANGSARMLRGRDGWAVANLARPEDLELFEAWIGSPAGADPWASLAPAARELPVNELVERARLLGLPAAAVGPASDEQSAARPGQAGGAPQINRWGPVGAAADASRLLVVDLSGLWAGPLCGRLFAELGARVIKVESTRRPDGARAGPAGFFARMNATKESATFDFTTESGRAALRKLIGQADVVIEASRPRALAQLGIDPAETAHARPHLVWISLTAYGRTGPWSNAVGFGDDCAAAAGLVVQDAAGAPLFVGDAVADPVAGVMAAGAGFAALAAGGGALVDVSLREAAGFVAQAPVAAVLQETAGG